MSSSLNDTLRQLWAREKFTYGVRVFIALAGAMALCWYLDRIAFVIPLFLGCIASALAEESGRLEPFHLERARSGTHAHREPLFHDLALESLREPVEWRDE